MPKKPKAPTVSLFLLVMMNVAAICSIKNWPLTAEYGLTSLFYLMVASLCFFLPASLVSAELATGWPKHGGVYVWVTKAFGHRLGFLAVWLLWIENVVWYPTTLSFVASTIAFMIRPDLIAHPLYMFLMVLGIFWLSTLIVLTGIKMSSWVSSIGVILGLIIPGALIIVLGCFWVWRGHPLQITFSWNTFLPRGINPYQLSIFAGILLSFAGIEMTSVHASFVKDPQKNYPRAIFLSALFILLFSTLGTLAIAIVIPSKEISLVSGGLDAITHFLTLFQCEWGVPIIAGLIVLGVIGAINAWAAGPSQGLLAVAKGGDLPPCLRTTNRSNMPTGILIAQGIIVSLLSTIFLLMPSINGSFWILLTLASQLYLLMYILLFLSAIVLRYRAKDKYRAYRIPGGKYGMWLVSGIGILSSLFAMIMGFFPPEQIEIGGMLFYELFLSTGIIFSCAAPFVISLFKQPSWTHSPPLEASPDAKL